MTPVIHYGNMIRNGERYLLITLPSGLDINVLWRSEHDLPTQSWWNNTAPEWTTIEALIKGG